MNRLHYGLAEAVVKCVDRIFGEGKYADKVIEKALKQNRKWGSRDRGFIAEHTYEIVRWWRLLRYCAGIDENDANAHIWTILGTLFIFKGYEMPRWKEFSSLDASVIHKRRLDADKITSIRESIPDWMHELGKKELRDEWVKEIHALNEQASLIIRVNTAITSIATLQHKLELRGFESEQLTEQPAALRFLKRGNLFATPEFKEGLFEVQDASSQMVAPFLNPIPGSRVIDACAGAGGKTLHLAAIMQNKGKIIALDKEAYKLEELKKRARRAGAGIIESRPIESSKTIKRLHESADYLLLDVPCSGLGVIRRNPDAKWKLKSEFMDNVRLEQKKILQDYSLMLKPGGFLLYSTCSILPSENEQQVSGFLSEHQGFRLIQEKKIKPSSGFDGFYMALMKREK